MGQFTKSNYPDVIVNAFQSVQAWRSLALVLIGIFVFETVALACGSELFNSGCAIAEKTRPTVNPEASTA